MLMFFVKAQILTRYAIALMAFAALLPYLIVREWSALQAQRRRTAAAEHRLRAALDRLESNPVPAALPATFAITLG